MPDVPTTDQLRNAIDSGATGDKVGFPDPAAAPLGTDAEAGGYPPTHQERKMEARSQTVHPERKPFNAVLVYLLLAALIAAAMFFVAFLAR